MTECLKDKDVVLAPKDYEKHCSGETTRLLQRLGKKNKLILRSYEMDEGYMIVCNERNRILAIRNAKKK